VNSNGWPYYVYAKPFNANGTPAGPQVLVHAGSTSSQRIGNVDAAMDADGNFVVSLDFGDIYSTEVEDVWARRFTSTGVPLGDTFRVNTTVNGPHHGNKIAMNDAGHFALVWYGRPSSGSGEVAFGRRFHASGTPLGGEFQINSSGTQCGDGVDVAIAPNGGFVATWLEKSSSLSLQIMARAYDSAGAPFGNVVQASLATNDNSSFPSIGMDPAGNHTITWLEHRYSSTQPRKILARRFSASGAAIQLLGNGQTLTPLAGVTGSWQYFKLTVPPGHGTVDINTFGGVGDADLYVRWGALPTLTAWDGRPWLTGNSEGVRMLGYPSGDWYIGINGYAAYSSLSLRAVSY